MRDNHKGMPEILEAFEKDGHYFAVVRVEINDVSKKFQFGASRAGYWALKQALQLRPLDMLPGLKYRFFYRGSWKSSSEEIYRMKVRVELNKDSTSAEIIIPKDLHANLLWFDRLKSFDDALYLKTNDGPDS